MALQTTVEHVEARVPVTVVALDGELDASNFERLIEEVRGLYAAGDRTLLLDLSGLTFMASSGLVALHTIVLVMQGEEPQDPEVAGPPSMRSATRSTLATARLRSSCAAPSPP